jgi:hypothetical protein
MDSKVGQSQRQGIKSAMSDKKEQVPFSFPSVFRLTVTSSVEITINYSNKISETLIRA